MTNAQQAMVERVTELERMVVRLNGRIGLLQRELSHRAGAPTARWSPGARLRSLLGGTKAAVATPQSIRQNRRIHHDLCLF